MSRVGKVPIPIPAGVKVRQDGGVVHVEGPKGKGQHQVPRRISVEVSDGAITVKREGDDREARSLHGLTRNLLANIVTGLSTGFSQTLEIVGVGYRAEVKGNAIQLNLGSSHPILYQLPEGVQAKVDRQTMLILEGNNRQVLGEVASQIRGLRPPEPYKGKGVKYVEERVRRKAGKAAGAGGR
jgi:large subunit ribosomal protein L6